MHLASPQEESGSATLVPDGQRGSERTLAQMRSTMTAVSTYPVHLRVGAHGTVNQRPLPRTLLR